MAEGERNFESSLVDYRSNNVPLKVILLGVREVGKTSIFLHIKEKKFYEDTSEKRTDSLTRTIRVHDQVVQMYLCDTAGMERHERTLTRSYYLQSQVALLVYSADDQDSADDLIHYMDQVTTHSPGAKKFLVRNKIDLDDQSVNEMDVDKMFRKHGYNFAPEWKFKTSARTGEGIETLLEEIGKVLLKQGSIKPDEKNSFQVYKPPRNRKPCC